MRNGPRQSGLDRPRNDRAGPPARRDLQAALIVTDRELQPLDEYCCDVWQPEEAMARDVAVRARHARKNGLLARVRASRVDLREAQRQLMARVAARCDFPAVL